MVLTCESADEILLCDNSIETFSAISFHGTPCTGISFFFLIFFFFGVLKFDSQVTTGIEMVKTLRTSSSDVVL